MLNGKLLVTAQAPILPKSEAMSVSGKCPSIASDATTAASTRTLSVLPPGNSVTCCWMECGTSEHLTNIGNARSVKWVCGACNSSRKAIDRQARDTAGCKEALSELKKNLNEYKATVRNNRLQVQIKQGQGQSALGRALNLDRAKQIVHCFSTTAEVINQVSTNTDVHWMDELEYIAYHKFTKGLEHTQASVIVYYHYMCICIYIYIYICAYMMYYV